MVVDYRPWGHNKLLQQSSAYQPRHILVCTRDGNLGQLIRSFKALISTPYLSLVNTSGNKAQASSELALVSENWRGRVWVWEVL